jgi:hypothetical protein
VKPVLVLLGDVLVEILGDAELPVQLQCISLGSWVQSFAPHLIEGDTIVDQVEETVIPDGFLCGRHELLDNRRVWRVHQGKIDGVELGVVEILRWSRGRNPLRNLRLVGVVGRRVERGSHVGRCKIRFEVLSSQIDAYPSPPRSSLLVLIAMHAIRNLGELGAGSGWDVGDVWGAFISGTSRGHDNTWSPSSPS